MGQFFADQYSLLHAAVGVLAYFWGIGLFNSFILHTLFEWVENTSVGMQFINTTLKGIWPGGKPNADSFINRVGDSVAFGIGWLSAKALDDLGTSRKWY